MGNFSAMFTLYRAIFANMLRPIQPKIFIKQGPEVSQAEQFDSEPATDYGGHRKSKEPRFHPSNPLK